MTTERVRDVPLLARRDFCVILLVVVAFFLVGMGPVWRDPFDYYKLARSIIWSYVPIPLLVLGFLAIRRRLTFASWLVSTILMTVTKFAVTATIMVIIWSLSGEPPKDSNTSRPPLPEFLPAPRAPPPPPVAAAEVGRVSGRVLDAAGAPAPGVLVWLDGLAPRTHPPRADVVVMTNDGTGPQPRDAAVQVGQPLVLRSLDGRIHTLMGEHPDGSMLFNRPILPGGPDHPVVLSVAAGETSIRCTVHPDEAKARLRVLAHPFFVTTGADGTFAFDGVPAGHVVVLAAPGGVDRSASGALSARGELTVEIVTATPGG